MNRRLFSHLAIQGMRANRRIYLPYLLAVMGTAAGFYNICAIALDPGIGEMRGAAYVAIMAEIGTFIAALFAAIFLNYTNSFLMKQRTRELALYNVLGMGKRHIALIMLWESIYTAAAGVGGGLAAGVVFYKLVTLSLHRLLRLEVPFGFSVSAAALIRTAVLFLLIIAAALFQNLLRIRKSDPIALLHSASAGEREPRSRVLLAALGVLALGGGYGLALWTKNSAEALMVYFLAVFLVMIGTYCLFTAVSIVVLKALRRSRNYYYRTPHFIGISGMLFRMKQNAAGLANICILSTMVLVMISGTLSLYLGMGDVVRRQIPSDFMYSIYYDMENRAGPDIEALESRIEGVVESQGQSVLAMEGNHYTYLVARGGDGIYNVDDESQRRGNVAIITFVTAQDYAALAGVPVPPLGSGEILLWGDDSDVLEIRSGDDAVFTFTTAEKLTEFPEISGGMRADYGVPVFAVVRDMDSLKSIAERTDHLLRYELRVDTTGTADEKYALGEYLSGMEADYTGTGEWDWLSTDSYESIYSESFGMAGGFLFLGVFLGLLFIMATVLIIYYKQVSEGYSDRERFQIMQKVGLEKRDIRRLINSQVMTVFFLPLLVAGVHVLFDFRLMLQLLLMFGITDVLTTVMCSMGTLLCFIVLYAAVYSLTARVYYRIVS